MITELTQQQKDKFPEYVEKWKSYGLSTDAINREETQAAITKMYHQAGLKTPVIIWTASPLANPLAKILLEELMKEAPVRDYVWASVLDSVRDSVWDAVWASVRDYVSESVRESVRFPVSESVSESVRDYVRDSVRDYVRDYVSQSVRDYVSESVRFSVWDAVWASVRDYVRFSVRDSVWDAVWASVRDYVSESVRFSVWDAVWASVRDYVSESVRESVRFSVWGQHEAAWLSFYEYFRNECGLISETEKLEGLFQLCQNSGWILPYKYYCFVSDRHYICNLQDGVIHCDGGPAIAYKDGFEVHALWGVRVPKWVSETPYEQLDLKKIMAIERVDVRSVALKRYGTERIIEAGYGKIIEDQWNTSGYRLIDLSSIFKSYDYAPHLYMKNPSIPGLVHCEGVPPEIKTIDQALKWREDRMDESFHKVIHT